MKFLKNALIIALTAVMILSVFAVIGTADASSTIYLDASFATTGEENWYVWTWGGVSDKWIKGTKASNGYIQFSGVGTSVIFARINGSKSSPGWESGTLWNRTGDLTVSDTLFVIESWGSGNDPKMTGYWTDLTSASTTTETDYYELADTVDDGMILQVWNWSYNNTVSMLEKVKKAGFTTIQVSPPNELCGATANKSVEYNWSKFYQPAGFRLNTSGNNALGKKTELINMVNKAHSMGIKVIADAVINHVGGNGNVSAADTDPIAHVNNSVKYFEPEIYDNNLFHSPWVKMTYKEHYYDGYSDYDIEEDLTQHCTSNLPDLNTADSRVQSAIYKYLKECVDAGIDGFRIDAAKHIETPSDTYFGSDFWPNTLGKVREYGKSVYNKPIYAYGEILNTCGDGRSFSEYTPYMEVTDSGFYYSIANNVHGGSAASALPLNTYNVSKQNSVLYDETHDTYTDGSTRGCSETELNKRWAAFAARDGITSVYLARPNDYSQNLGVASESYWANTSVKEVNNFSNMFVGKGEYLDNGSNVAVIGRGSKGNNGGAVLINCDKGTYKSISGVPVHTLANGTYRDRISGNSFTVNNNTVSGTIGETGIAVLYRDQTPMVYAAESGKYYTDTLSLDLFSKRVDYATYEYNGSTPIKFTGNTAVSIGSESDSAGAVYKVTVKGYRSNEVVAENSYEYKKAPKESAYSITLKTNSVSGWSSTPYIYAWNSKSDAKLSDWPGEKMSGSSGIYTFSLSPDFDRVIFNTGSGGKQTVDIPITESTTYTILSETAANSDGTECNKVSSSSDVVEPATYYPGITPTTSPTTTAEPTTEAPTTEAPTTEPTEEPTTAPPTTESPEPTTQEPTTEEPSTAEPTTEVPTTEPPEPTTEEPTTEPPEPTTQEPTTEPPEPTTQEPTTEPPEPTTEEPTTEPPEPTTEEPTTAEPTAEPVTTAPIITPTEPLTTEPIIEPTIGPTELTTAAPVTEPSTEAPTTEPETEIPTAEPPTTEPATSAYHLGDVDRDGIITVSDATMIMRHLVNIVALDDEQLALADVDQSGAITMQDATKLLRILVKIDTF